MFERWMSCSVVFHGYNYSVFFFNNNIFLGSASTDDVSAVWLYVGLASIGMLLASNLRELYAYRNNFFDLVTLHSSFQGYHGELLQL